MEHVAQRSRFTLDFGQVTPDVWNQASQLSRPDMFCDAPEPASLVPVFRAIAQPRTTGPATPPSAGGSAAHASYPQVATQPNEFSSLARPRPVRYGILHCAELDLRVLRGR